MASADGYLAIIDIRHSLCFAENEYLWQEHAELRTRGSRESWPSDWSSSRMRKPPSVHGARPTWVETVETRFGERLRGRRVGPWTNRTRLRHCVVYLNRNGREMWQTILAKRNREIIGFVSAGVAAILAGAWVIFVYVLPPEPTKQSVPPTNIIAGCSVVSGGSISTTSIDVKCGPSAAEIEVLVSKLVSKQDLMGLIKSVRDQSAFDRKMMTDLSTKVGLTQAQLASIIDTLSKEAIGPGDVFAKFALATRDYIDISIDVCKSFRLNPQKQSSKVFILRTGFSWLPACSRITSRRNYRIWR